MDQWQSEHSRQRLTLGVFVLPLVKAHAGVAAVLMMTAIVSALGAVLTAIVAREVGEIPEGRSIDETEVP